MRIGIFGGSFDPIHIAHLLLAETALEQLKLDQVRFVPAAQSPLKDRQPTIATDRREMVHLATCGQEKFVVDDRELRREGPSYTVDTLEQIKGEYPAAELFLMMGSDALLQFNQWRRPDEICRLARLAVAVRGGEPVPDFRVLAGVASDTQINEFQTYTIMMPILELSSTDIRLRASDGRSIRYRTPAAVAAYIQSKKLYQAKS
jgi:nicotinate-nucleotide adenylyltransferase